METAMTEDSVLSMAKDVEQAFWADEEELELYFRHQRLLMDAYSDEHTYEILLKQERERTEQEKERAEQEREKAEQEREKAEQEREKAEQEKEKAEQERKRAEQEKEKAEQERKRAEQAELEKEKAVQDSLERGRQMALEMADNLLKLGVEMERIVKASGLSEEEIRGNHR